MSSGKESDFYLDARLVTLSAAGAYLTARIMLDMIDKDQPDAIGGPTLGADPMVGAIASLAIRPAGPSTHLLSANNPRRMAKSSRSKALCSKRAAVS